MRTFLRTFVLSTGVAATLLAASTHAEPAPTVQALLEKHAAAVGPVDSIQTRRVKARVTGMAPFEIPVVIEASRPNLIRKDVNIRGSLQVTAFDGKKAWKTDPFVPNGATPSPLSPDEAKALMDEADFAGALIKPETKGVKVAYVGESTAAGRKAYELRLTLPTGTVANVWLDAQTWLEAKRSQPAVVAGKVQTVETTLGDYRDVQGIKFPYKLETGVAGVPQKATILIDAVELNPRIDRARFEKP